MSTGAELDGSPGQIVALLVLTALRGLDRQRLTLLPRDAERRG